MNEKDENNSESSSYNNFLRKVAISGFIFTIIAIILFAWNVKNIFDFGQTINGELFAQFGSFIGAILSSIFSLTGVYYVVRSIENQDKEHKDQLTNQETQFQDQIDIQDKRVRLQSIESRFFELLKIHRDNVTEFASGKNGRAILIEFTNEFDELYNKIKDWVSIVVVDEFPAIEMSIKITYSILFFGTEKNISKEFREQLRLINKEEKPTQKTDNVKPSDLDTFYENLNGLIEDRNEAKKIGYQSMFGHYYRHLFQTVNFINDQPSNLLSYEKKYLYVKTLRAQLSTHEQMVFFYNSLSSFGLDWERGIEEGNIDKRLITKYNLIANIPEGFVVGIDPSRIYKEVHYEFNGNKKTKARLDLEKTYT